MDWIEEVKQKQKRKNTILLSKNSPVLHRLKMRLSECNRRAVVLWALELANEAATALKKRNTNGILAEKAVAAANISIFLTQKQKRPTTPILNGQSLC